VPDNIFPILSTESINDILWILSSEFNKATHNVYQRCFEKEQSSEGDRGVSKELMAEGWSEEWARSIYVQTFDFVNLTKKDFENQLAVARVEYQDAKEKMDYLLEHRTKLSGKAVWEQKITLDRITSKKSKLEKMEVDGKYPITFGGRELFNSQHSLEENGYQNKTQWELEWFVARHKRFLLSDLSSEGKLTKTLKIQSSDSDNSLELLLPSFLAPFNNARDWLTLPLETKIQTKVLGDNLDRVEFCYNMEQSNWQVQLRFK
jgi:hypothetical protein